jgi:hypothetical protein
MTAIPIQIKRHFVALNADIMSTPTSASVAVMVSSLLISSHIDEDSRAIIIANPIHLKRLKVALDAVMKVSALMAEGMTSRCERGLMQCTLPILLIACPMSPIMVLGMSPNA